MNPFLFPLFVILVAMSYFAYGWIIKRNKPKTNVEQEMKKKKLKNLFRIYFEGIGEFVEPIDPISISTFGITDIQFEFKSDVTDMIITLERPGMLIGRHGRTIDGVTQFLSDKNTPVKIKIVESKLWR